MSAGEKYIVAALKSGDGESLFKISPDWLIDTERDLYAFSVKYFRDHKALPPISLVEEKFDVDTAKTEAKPEFYLEELKDRNIYISLTESVPKLMRDLRTSPRETLQRMKTIISNVSVEVSPSTDIRYDEEKEKRLDRYKKRIESGGITYMSTGDAVLDSYLHGYERTDLVTLAARAGLGKTWILCKLALQAEPYLPTGFDVILFISNEMSADELMDRMDCIRFKLAYTAFLEGSLSEKDLSRYRKGLSILNSPIVVINRCTTIDEVAAKIALYKPAACFLDGSYLLEPRMKGEYWQKIMFVTQNLKMVANSYLCPIINTTQLKRATGKKKVESAFDAQDDFAFGGSYVQDSDVAFRAYQEPDMKFKDLIGLQFAKGRRVKPDSSLQFKMDLIKMDLLFKEDDSIKETKRIDF